jgi:hypothetical protein
VIAIEHPELRCTKADLSPAADSVEIQALVQELAADDLEDRSPGATACMSRDSSVARKAAEESVPSTNPSTEIPKPGILDHLTRAAAARHRAWPGRDSGFGGRSEFQRRVEGHGNVSRPGGFHSRQ